jgi:hypothetical protein
MSNVKDFILGLSVQIQKRNIQKLKNDNSIITYFTKNNEYLQCMRDMYSQIHKHVCWSQ